MSTFDGIIEEFPYIQVDYFRKSPERPPPLACFLSHVHTDHLQGLESFRAPFIYCSNVTRELLLRIEKYPHRMNFSKGILESRRLHYKHLSKLLRPIPLNTPTEIELTPRLCIRVTLLDANHCAGSVMFLIEGDGKAILYTGDIRAESWWIKSLVRHPVLLPYTLGRRRLDKIYLDTTFAVAIDKFRAFPSKADGIAELLKKVEHYPKDTIFYFRAWTFGYEDVWVALSAALNTRVHLDNYQMGLYKSLGARPRGNCYFNEASPLCGFDFGNRYASGCLSDDESSRIHSCEPGVTCPIAQSRKTVCIIPIVNRTNDGLEVPDKGAGGGLGDLYQTHDLELPDKSTLDELERLCFEHIQDDDKRSRITGALLEAFQSKSKSLSLDSYGMKDDNEIPLQKLVKILSQPHPGSGDKKGIPISTAGHGTGDLPDTINFPYSRHSSYSELCEFVSAFKPKDIHPCTVNPSTWTEDVSIGRLFGHLCSGDMFPHDVYMREVLSNTEEELHPRKKARYDAESSQQSTQRTSTTDDSDPGAIMGDIAEISDVSERPKTALPVTDGLGMMDGDVTKTDHAADADMNTANLKRKYPHSEPLNVPALSVEEENTKRAEIRHARQFLEQRQTTNHKNRNRDQSQSQNESQSQSQSGIVCVGSLPSSWEEEDGEVGVLDDINMELGIGIAEPGQEKEQRRKEEEHDSQSSAATTSTSTLSVSIANSAFDSQEHAQQLHEYNDSNNYGTSHRSTMASRLRARKEAYVAARADSYEAWSSVSLLSAGNNHAEAEMEL